MLTLKKLIELLTPCERRRTVLLLVMILIMALLDVIGVASIMPFMAVLSNPQFIEGSTILTAIYSSLGFGNTQSFLFFLGVAAFAVLVVSLVFKALTTYTQTHFTLMCEYSIGRRLIEAYLRQPYAWFLDRHTADLSKAILSEVGQIIYGAMVPTMTLLTQGAVALAILAMLLIIDPKLALIVVTALGATYGIIFNRTSGYLKHLGVKRKEANRQRFVAVSEAFGGIKAIKVGGLEDEYAKRYSRPASILPKCTAASLTVAQIPRFALEAVAFGGMLLAVLYLMGDGSNFNAVLPTIALYAFSGYRLMPALHQVYSSFTQLRFAGSALDCVHADLVSLALPAPRERAIMAMKLKIGIVLKGIHFAYPKAKQPVLQDLNLNIPVRRTVGLVGVTGSGKTTVVDIILGLFEPSAGRLEVDGTLIDANNRRQWQHAIGYVPQEIYLTDETVAANIAFGIEPGAVDLAAVKRAARIANLHDFVMGELPQAYDTIVGERGVRLSGGQRQRIGIARALYHEPQVLVLDEATSALDNLTEQAVMEAVRNLSHEITIILVAHRLSTVRECDQIYMLSHGRIVAQGAYDELVKGHESFRAMAGR